MEIRPLIMQMRFPHRFSTLLTPIYQTSQSLQTDPSAIPLPSFPQMRALSSRSLVLKRLLFSPFPHLFIASYLFNQTLLIPPNFPGSNSRLPQYFWIYISEYFWLLICSLFVTIVHQSYALYLHSRYRRRHILQLCYRF